LKPSSWGCSIKFLLLVCLALISQIASAQILRISEAMVDAVPLRTQAEKNIKQLPYRWDMHFPGDNGKVTYSIVLPATAIKAKSNQLMALYAPRVGNQVLIRLNGETIWKPGLIDDLCLDASKAPMWVTFSEGLLQIGKPNVLEIQTVVQALRWAGLSELYFGPADQLMPMYKASNWWSQTAYLAILAVLLVIGLIAAYIWREQRDKLYGFFALSALFGALSAFNQIQVQATFLNWPLLGIASSVALAWHVLFMARFALGVAGNDQPWIRLALMASLIVIGIAHFLAHPMYWTIAVGLICVPAGATLIVTAKKADQDKTIQARWLFLLMLVLTLTAMRDFFIVHWPESGMNHYAYLPHALFLFALLMGWILAKRYTQQHTLYQELNQTLEQRVQTREAELQESFQTINKQSEEKAKLLERQRIMTDIHDGVGGQLVGLVNMIKRGEENQSLFDQKQLAEHAQMALDELRVAVDALQPVDGDLATVLATLRYRLEPRLRASDITLVWHIDELPPMLDLTPQKVLQIQKILLEAFTNIMQHANAKIVTVTAKFLTDISSIQIGIEDDGVGFDMTALKSKGHGLKNMSFRAEAIGALITFERAQQKGASLTLTMPIV
jgi:signal transduction histidine kinase